MQIIRSLLRIAYCLYALLVFSTLMLIAFALALIASLFGRIRGGNLIYRICCFWGDCWFFLIGIRHTNSYESPHDHGRAYIFVANHISYLDPPMIVKTLRRPVRPLGKAEMARLPFFGFIYQRAIVTVNRSSTAHRARSVRVLKSVLRKGISVFIFPEGTFNETGQPLKDFFDGAFRIAIETQTPIKPVLFLDTYSRMHYNSLFSLNPGPSRCVFLEEVPVEGLNTADVQILKEKVYRMMDEKLRAYKAAWIA